MTKEIVRKTHFSLCDSFLNCIDEREGDTVDLGGGRMGNFRSNVKKEETKYEEHKKILNKTSSIKNELILYQSNEDETLEEYQLRISKIFSKYKYPSKIIKNDCGEKISSNTRIVDFTQSQQFISNFFTPGSPFGGLLVWHSVGTGKTCTAIATKSLLFEKQDYTILWVTRTSLRDDIWKNMFKWVCDHNIRKLINSGINVPEDPEQKRDYINRNFLQPISYKQFSNALSRSGQIYEKLSHINGKEDFLKKTLIIIDEAHKIYGKDLVGMEKPNTSAIETSIFSSYKISGTQSCKVMLMTGTPIADHPIEFIKLMNLLIRNSDDRFPSDFDVFSRQYLKGSSFTKQGKDDFQNRLKGLISYLNRSFDPNEFAQPSFKKIHVPLSRFKEDLELQDCEKVMNDTYEKERKEVYNLENCMDNVNNKYKKILIPSDANADEKNTIRVTNKMNTQLRKEAIKTCRRNKKVVDIHNKTLKKSVTMERNKCKKTNKQKVRESDANSKGYQFQQLKKCNVDVSEEL